MPHPAAPMTEQTAKSLYNPEFERDSCGFGLIANMDDMPSHWVIETSIAALARLTHRGAVAADGKTGDGSVDVFGGVITTLASTKWVLDSQICYELNREANTLGSKSQDSQTTQWSVDLKVLIEQMREQVQNIE